jgi:hypothetical protein
MRNDERAWIRLGARRLGRRCAQGDEKHQRGSESNPRRQQESHLVLPAEDGDDDARKEEPREGGRE